MPTEHTTVMQNTRSTANRLHEFDPTSYDWDDWEILFDTYISVEGITDDNKKRNLLITALGVQPFKTLISICKPKKPTEFSYIEVIQKLRSNYARVTFPSTERIKFFATRQESLQSLTDFANRLRDNTAACAFPSDFYQDALIAAFVGGLRNDHVRKHLMQQDLKTFEHTINAAKTIESIFIEGSTVSDRSSHELSLQKIDKSDMSTSDIHHKAICQSCGATDHSREKCRFRHAICHNCSRKATLLRPVAPKIPQQMSYVNTLSTPIVQGATRNDGIQIPVQINSREVDLELDTGSPFTIINDDLWAKIGKPTLQPTKMDLNSFTGHHIRLKGEKMVNVNYDGLSVRLRLLVVDGRRSNILGRDWIEALHLNKKTLADIASDTSVFTFNLEKKSLNDVVNRQNGTFKQQPSGTVSAICIFQNITNKLLAGLDNTVCYTDDISVSRTKSIPVEPIRRWTDET